MCIRVPIPLVRSCLTWICRRVVRSFRRLLRRVTLLTPRRTVHVARGVRVVRVLTLRICAGRFCLSQILRCRGRFWRPGGGLEPFTTQHVDGTTTMPTASCGTGGSAAPCAPTSATSGLGPARTTISTSPDVGFPAGVNCILAPADYVCPTSPSDPGAPTKDFLILRPQTGETYDQYANRLRANGWLGNITFLDDQGYSTSPYPAGSPALALQPGTVTAVGVGVTLPLSYPIYDPTTGKPAPWPSTIPTIANSTTTTIAVQRVPAGYSPPPPDNGQGTSPGSGGTTPTPGGGCKCPPINFKPLENINYGGKFPFGLFTWLASNLSAFGGTSVAPDIALTAPPGSYVSGQDLNFADANTGFGAFRSVEYPIVEFLISLGCIWFLANKILGIGGGSGESDD